MTSDHDEVVKIVAEYVWGQGYPEDEADCCADAILESGWLAAIKREAKSEAWAEGYEAAQLAEREPLPAPSSINPYRALLDENNETQEGKQ